MNSTIGTAMMQNAINVHVSFINRQPYSMTSKMTDELHLPSWSKLALPKISTANGSR
jgi:hypothetical protein